MTFDINICYEKDKRKSSKKTYPYIDQYNFPASTILNYRSTNFRVPPYEI